MTGVNEVLPVQRTDRTWNSRASEPAGGKKLTSQHARTNLLSSRLNQKGDVVDCSDCFLGNESLSSLVTWLPQCSGKKALNLRGNQIDGDGILILAQMLKANDTILILNLEWNNVGLLDHGMNAFAAALEVNDTLREIDLRNNNIGPDGAIALAKALHRNKTVRSLDLRWNDIGFAGGQAFAKALEVNQYILNFQISGNNISMDCMAGIEKALLRNKELQAKDEHSSLFRSPDDENTLLLSYLTDKEKLYQNLQETLKEKEDLKDTIENKIIEIKDLKTQLSHSNEQIISLQNQIDNLRISMKSTNDQNEKILTKQQQEYEKLYDSKLLLEKEASTLKDNISTLEIKLHDSYEQRNAKIEELKDHELEMLVCTKKQAITIETTRDQLQRVRDQLQEERKLWEQELKLKEIRSIEQIQSQEEKHTNELKRMKEEVEETHKLMKDMQEKNHLMQVEIERLRTELAGKDIENANNFEHMHQNLQRDLEKKNATRLQNLESEVKKVSELRNRLMDQISHQAEEMKASNDSHLNQITRYEERLREQTALVKILTEKKYIHENEILKLDIESKHLKDQVSKLEQDALENNDLYEKRQKKYDDEIQQWKVYLEKQHASFEKELKDKNAHLLIAEEKLMEVKKELQSERNEHYMKLNNLADSLIQQIRGTFEMEKVDMEKRSK